MNAELFAAFVVSALLLMASPGPVNVAVMGHAVAFGWRRAMVTNAGACLSLAVQLALTVIGVGAAVAYLGRGFELLRWLGAAYLAWLGVAQWRAAAPGGAAPPPPRASKLFWQGVLVSSTNPKSLLVFPAFFPQFVDPARPALAQLATLATIFLIMSALTFAALAGLAHVLQPWFAVGRRALWRDRIFGAALVLVAASLILGI